MPMRTLRRLAGYGRVLGKARRYRTDFVRYLIRRPAIFAAVGAYETAIVISNRADTRLKHLAGIKASSLIGCPF